MSADTPSSLKGGTLFSGIGAPELAAPWIDWRWCAEIEPFASAVHKTRFEGVLNLGDVTKIDPSAVEPVDIIVFGSPCQSFSVAGKRLGLDDPRGNLALVALRLVSRLRPQWFLFENVPGLLSSDEGRDFGAFVGTVEQCGYGWSYRTLDAQHFGVPQRRRRVFVVGCLGGWRGAAAVLFEPQSLRRHPAPGRAAGEGIAAPLTHGAESGGNGGYAGRRREDDVNLVAAYGGNNTSGSIDVATACNAHGGPNGRQDFETETFIIADPITSNEQRTYCNAGNNHRLHNVVTHCLPAVQNGGYATEDGTGRGIPLVAHALTAEGFDASEDGTGRGPPLTLAIRGRGDSHDLEWRDDGTSNAILTPNGGRAGIGVGAVAFAQNQRGELRTAETAAQLTTGGGKPGEGYPAVAFRIHSDNSVNGASEVEIAAAVNSHAGSSAQSSQGRNVAMHAMSVRRLTPRECERLQGFPDDFTLIAYRGKPAADGPRYRALGNSMAVPVVRWILARIEIAGKSEERTSAHER